MEAVYTDSPTIVKVGETGKYGKGVFAKTDIKK